MEIVRCRLQQERPGFGRKGREIQRKSTDGSRKPGQSERDVVQAGCGVTGSRNDLRWRGRRGDHQDGLMGGDSDRNCNDGEQLGDHTHSPSRRITRSGRLWQGQKSQGRFWRWLQSFATFWWARQVDLSQTCCWHIDPQCFTDLTFIWNHRALKKRNFCSPWQASVEAVDLAREVGTWNQLSHKQFCMGERGLFRGHVRFADSVDLYVGHEDDLIMRNWPHALEVPHPKAKVFTPIETIPNSEQLLCGSTCTSTTKFSSATTSRT